MPNRRSERGYYIHRAWNWTLIDSNNRLPLLRLRRPTSSPRACTGQLIVLVSHPLQDALVKLYYGTDLSCFAALRRHGMWRQDLNVDLSNPFTRQIASSWSRVFESDLFASFEQATMDVIKQLIADVEASAAPGLKDRAKGQGELCLEEARGALRKTLDVVSEAMNTQQKEISRCLAPHVQGQLVDGYDRAMEERGRGSVARQKVRPSSIAPTLRGTYHYRALAGRLPRLH